MIYVLDASVALKWVLIEPDSAKALALRREFEKGMHDFVVPDIFITEICHVLVKAEHRKIIPQNHSRVYLTDIFAVPPRQVSFKTLVPRALNISLQRRSSFYDCLYVALAERENCEFITSDQRLINNLQPQFPFIIPLSFFP